MSAENCVGVAAGRKCPDSELDGLPGRDRISEWSIPRFVDSESLLEAIGDQHRRVAREVVTSNGVKAKLAVGGTPFVAKIKLAKSREKGVASD